MNIGKRLISGAFWGVLGCFAFKIIVMKMTNKHFDAYDMQLVYWIVAGIVSSVGAKSIGAVFFNPAILVLFNFKDLKEMYEWKATRMVFFSRAGALLIVAIVVGILIMVCNIVMNSGKQQPAQAPERPMREPKPKREPKERPQYEGNNVFERGVSYTKQKMREQGDKADLIRDLKDQREKAFKETGYKYNELFTGVGSGPDAGKRVNYLNQRYPGLLDALYENGLIDESSEEEKSNSSSEEEYSGYDNYYN